ASSRRAEPYARGADAAPDAPAADRKRRGKGGPPTRTSWSHLSREDSPAGDEPDLAPFGTKATVPSLADTKHPPGSPPDRGIRRTGAPAPPGLPARGLSPRVRRSRRGRPRTIPPVGVLRARPRRHRAVRVVLRNRRPRSDHRAGAVLPRAAPGDSRRRAPASTGRISRPRRPPFRRPAPPGGASARPAVLGHQGRPPPVRHPLRPRESHDPRSHHRPGTP